MALPGFIASEMHHWKFHSSPIAKETSKYAVICGGVHTQLLVNGGSSEENALLEPSEVLRRIIPS